MPGKQHFACHLCTYVFLYESFEQLLTHHVAWFVVVEVLLLEVVAVLARQIATSPNGLEHHIERTGKREDGTIHNSQFIILLAL